VTDQLRVFVADCTFPVAVMVVEMQHDNGYIGWLLEPSLGNDRSRLRLAKAVAMQLATSQVVHQCVDEVDRWYDARRRGNLEWS
jgi:translation elongation factor EF-Ts